MPKYRVHFIEEHHYNIEFETDEPLNVAGSLDEAGDNDEDEESDDWFEAMDADQPDWYMRPEIRERDLVHCERLPDDYVIPKAIGSSDNPNKE